MIILKCTRCADNNKKYLIKTTIEKHYIIFKCMTCGETNARISVKDGANNG